MSCFERADARGVGLVNEAAPHSPSARRRVDGFEYLYAISDDDESVIEVVSVPTVGVAGSLRALQPLDVDATTQAAQSGAWNDEEEESDDEASALVAEIEGQELEAEEQRDPVRAMHNSFATLAILAASGVDTSSRTFQSELRSCVDVFGRSVQSTAGFTSSGTGRKGGSERSENGEGGVVSPVPSLSSGDDASSGGEDDDSGGGAGAAPSKEGKQEGGTSLVDDGDDFYDPLADEMDETSLRGELGCGSSQVDTLTCPNCFASLPCQGMRVDTTRLPSGALACTIAAQISVNREVVYERIAARESPGVPAAPVPAGSAHMWHPLLCAACRCRVGIFDTNPDETRPFVFSEAVSLPE